MKTKPKDLSPRQRVIRANREMRRAAAEGRIWELRGMRLRDTLHRCALELLETLPGHVHGDCPCGACQALRDSWRLISELSPELGRPSESPESRV